MTATVLLQGQYTFLGLGGEPLAGGAVYTYEVATVTPKTTWIDAAQTTTNTNPILLNSAGQALIYGTGDYRLVVKDSDGNDIADFLASCAFTQEAVIPFGLDTGSANAYVVSLNPAITSLVNGLLITVKFAHTNTTGCTINADGTGNVPMLDSQLNPLTPNTVIGGMFGLLQYSNTGGGYWQLLGIAATAGINITKTPYIVVNPIGNTIATLTSFNLQGTTGSTTTREFLVNIGFINDKGHSATGVGNKDKVALYIGTEITNSNSGDGWAVNTVTTVDSGVGSAVSAQGYELDFNNLSDDRSLGVGALAAGLSVTGAGNKLSTMGIFLSGPSAPIWDAGILFGNFCVQSATYWDQTNSHVSLLVNGIHNYGLDIGDGVCNNGAIRIAEAQSIVWKIGSSDFKAMSVSGANMLLADTTLAGTFIKTGFAPLTDNAYALGQPSNRWATVYAANGTIQTSDPAYKTDIAKLPSVYSLIEKIHPITYKFKVGGMERYEETELQDVQLQETIQVEKEVIGDDGILRTVVEDITRPVFDRIKVYDTEGKPVLNFIPGSPEVRDSEGVLLQEAVLDRWVQRYHSVPRMEKKAVSVVNYRERPGARTHWGFDAEQVGAVMKSTGLDFGGYVETDSGLGLRPDQLIAVLWKGLQEAMERIDLLEAKLGNV